MNINKKELNYLALAAMFPGVVNQAQSYLESKLTPKVKKCLNCGTEHVHKNSWCSAKCCKEYRLKQKGQK
jgi:hypothetical protein